MQLFSIIALLAAAVHCVQAIPERKLLRTGYNSGLDFSTLTGSTAGGTTGTLSSVTSLLPTSSGTSGILPSTDSLSSLTTGIGSLTNLVGTATGSSTSNNLLSSATEATGGSGTTTSSTTQASSK
ncbi:hypothetical protein PC116_g28200 [Phytophthora cactorum]|uniref:Uncharacterized protein n=1 Tax=Phytophthora cactorum TaxID=29920 RepID=A0A8T1JGI6_9STRA|nr:hypothetical protein PC115_g23619 [Phytophthora cactorum]KAG3040097.1 hypothetical protein PC121_g23644 [Phytophthora cactorum]KAG4037903.1 hypothetical protein PC123_g26533 [Phytophthora cactorum]KAG4223333.1 hypothetical protein PC116_g28200 [Phytophthora cactorum]